MPVAATVIADMDMIASVVMAFIDMPAQCSSTTFPDGMQGSQLPSVGHGLPEHALVPFQYLGHLEPRVATSGLHLSLNLLYLNGHKDKSVFII